MTITSTPRWSLGRGNAVVPSRWQATIQAPAGSSRSLTVGAEVVRPQSGLDARRGGMHTAAGFRSYSSP